MRRVSVLFAAIVSFAACRNTPDSTAVRIEGIDSSMKPGDNFFMYVNHKWYDTARILPSQSGVGAYMFMNYPQRLRLQRILDSVSHADNKAGSIKQKPGDFYASGMDTAAINRRGYEPILPLLLRIDSISNITSIMKYAVDEAKVYNTSLLAFSIGPDNKNSNLNIAHVYQTGIGLPDRDYYFNTDSSSVAVQQANKIYLSKLFALTSSDAATATKNANLVYDIDNQLASSHRTNVELRDVNANYNKMAVSDLVKRQPNIGWMVMLNDLGQKQIGLMYRNLLITIS